MKQIIYISILALAIWASHGHTLVCKSYFTVSSNPARAIVEEITGINADLTTIVPPGSSPHTYSLKPSVIRKAMQSKAIFYLSNEIDGWAVNIPDVAKIALFDLLPDSLKLQFETGHCGGDEAPEHDHYGHNHAHGAFDPHFWTDPLTVKAIVEPLRKKLSELDPDHAANYAANAANFSARLDLLHKQVTKILAPIRGSYVFLFHPSFNYMLKRYGLIFAGTIEDMPGKELSPQKLAVLIKKVQGSKTKSIFSEPQLPERPAKLIADEAGVSLFMLDPVGGVKGRNKYNDLILYNARVLQRAL